MITIYQYHQYTVQQTQQRWRDKTDVCLK